MKLRVNLKLGVRPHVGALIAYLLLSCLLTWPTVLDLSGHVYTSAGGSLAYPGHDDIVLNVWSIWWLDYALRSATNPFFTPLLYHPEGMQLYLQTFNVVSSILTLPAQWLAGCSSSTLTTTILCRCSGSLSVPQPCSMPNDTVVGVAGYLWQ